MSDFSRESTLHNQLKELYAGTEGQVEVPIETFICDCRTKHGELIEVQTNSFGPLRYKLQIIAKNYCIKIIHPIVRNRIIETYSADRVLLRKRLSPKKGSIWDLFKALIFAPELIIHKNIILELVALDITDTRIEDGKGSWRRKGISLKDKALLSLHDTRTLLYPVDYQSFLPSCIGETFTIRDFYNGIKDWQISHPPLSSSLFSEPILEPLSYSTAQKAIYVLHRIGLLKRTGKKGNFYLYRKNY
ncbi:hypothetical protein [Gracilinema caldarium]|uniref:DUF8091 domain-containing protein n=1 Tax=Gracilinema caldarium (strain ATCC 51460 / DSM 7334 / H1) TaxID=744872 RepID=F8F1Y7_GRAC1|nr:hypothetical protein [Gracilinema caldarium]AEJ19834.1 hypothetical protein Spica_1691 [Gracilinema caldarium DSM 7334]